MDDEFPLPPQEPPAKSCETTPEGEAATAMEALLGFVGPPWPEQALRITWLMFYRDL